jgi:hypothetical protein
VCGVCLGGEGVVPEALSEEELAEHALQVVVVGPVVEVQRPHVVEIGAELGWGAHTHTHTHTRQRGDERRREGIDKKTTGAWMMSNTPRHTVSQSVTQPVSQSVSQSLSESVSQSLSQSLSHSVSQ